jgi:hypothetical protein
MEISGKGSYLSMSEVKLQQQSAQTPAISFNNGSAGQLERCEVSTPSSIGIAMRQHAVLYLRLSQIQSGSYALQAQEFSFARVEGGAYRSLSYGKQSEATFEDNSSHIMYIQEDSTLS